MTSRNFTISRIGSLILLSSVLICIAVGCNKKESPNSNSSVAAANSSMTESERLVANLIKSEDLILDVTPRISKLAKWFQANSAGDSDELPADLKSCKSVTGLESQDPEKLFHTDSS